MPSLNRKEQIPRDLVTLCFSLCLPTDHARYQYSFMVNVPWKLEVLGLCLAHTICIIVFRDSTIIITLSHPMLAVFPKSHKGGSQLHDQKWGLVNTHAINMKAPSIGF